MNAKRKIRGDLFFDDTCALCRAGVKRLRPLLEPRGIDFVPFANGADEPEMRLQWHDGREFGGGDVIVFLAGQIWWARPFHWLARLPGMTLLVRCLYRQIASRRHCLSGACRLR
ncbi:MAG: DUF393 domain-containing protein [Verrucomicrobiae bacterium]|nr:DUF393 domain-containing protein [Verrucomicrobiae bacterium]